MSEPTIQALVDIQGSYTEYVDLRWELFEDSKNIGRMSSYRPITSHRQAFHKLAKSLDVKDKRSYLLVGTYGTGKSHLCLMLANYFRTPAYEQPMLKFFDNYAAVDPEEADALRARRSSGRYLVVLCDWSSRGDFEEVVLRAVDTALKREGFADDLDTPYLQALKKIELWQELAESGGPKGSFHSTFERLLIERNPGLTLAAFKSHLAAFDGTALEEFKQLHHEVTTASFAYDKTDLLAVLTTTLASTAFKQRFLGMLVLFDEFGDTIERGHMSPKMFQQFAQLCAETPSQCARIIFVGTSHKDLSTYAKAYNATEFRTASDRIVPVTLATDGVEDIIAAIVAPKKVCDLWREKVVPHYDTFDVLSTDCQRLKLFHWLKVPKIRESIIENIYPMHPMATHALLRLAEDIASNNRSIFTFFASEASPEADIGSYGYYVATSPIETGRKLNLYTADMLFDYFAPRLKSENKELRPPIRASLQDYESSLRELGQVVAQDPVNQLELQNDPLVARILRLMLIYQIIGVPNTQENLQFGLYCSTHGEREALENRLRTLTSKHILYQLKDTKVYEFKQSRGTDIEQLIEDYIQKPENMPANIVAELSALVPLDKKTELYLEAKDYNLHYGEDKRLENRFARAVDLGEEETTPQGTRTFFMRLEAEIEQEIAKANEFEGIALYIVCETAEEIQRAREYCTKNTSERIVVAIPKQSIPLLDTILEVRALQAIKASKTAESFSSQDHTILNVRLKGDGRRQGALSILRASRNKLMSNKEVTWHGEDGQLLRVEETKSHDVADCVMERVYASCHNLFIHDDFNRLHTKAERKNTALREAIEKLLDYATLIIDRSLAEGRGERRYLDKCLLQQNALKVVREERMRQICELEFDPQKFTTKLPALAAMIDEIRALKPGSKVRMTDWVKTYRQPPYGQGQVSLALSLSYLCRFFGDSIRFKHDESAIADLPVRSFEDVLNLIENQYPNAFLSYRQLWPEELELVNAVYGLFGQPESAVKRNYTTAEAYAVLQAWWDGLPSIAKITSLYPKEGYPYTVDFIQVMHKIGAKDAHTFLLVELPTVFGADPDMMITQETLAILLAQLPVQKQRLDSAVSIVEERIMNGVASLFGFDQSSTYSDISEAIATWYKNLDPNQRDAYAPWHDKDSKPLVLDLKSIETLQETFLVRIPTDYTLKPVQNWVADRSIEYVERLKNGKALIDANRLKVEVPSVTFIGEYWQDNNGNILFKDKISLSFQHSDSSVRIYIAEEFANPRDSTTARRLINCAESLEIQENKTFKVAAQDSEGNWSQVETIHLINQHKKYEIHLSERDESATIAFPTDVESFLVTCKSLCLRGLERDIFSTAQLVELLQVLVNEFNQEK